VVLKYAVDPPTKTGRAFIDVPDSAEILSVGLQGDSMVVWALVRDDEMTGARRLIVCNTGEQVPGFPEDARFIGTVTTANGIVWHVFDGGWGVMASRQAPTEARGWATIEHDLEWLRLVEERFAGVPVTDDFGTAYFTCAAKLETRLKQLLAQRDVVAAARDVDADYSLNGTVNPAVFEKLQDALAAVVSGTPEREAFHDMRRVDFEREQMEQAEAEDVAVSGTPTEGEK